MLIFFYQGYLVKELGIDTLALMRKIKLAMDPLYEPASLT